MWVRGPALVAMSCVALVLAACAQDIEGLRTPRSAASQSLSIRWHPGGVATYRWTLESSGASGGTHAISGDCDVAVLTLGAGHTARLELTFRIDPQYVSENQTGVVSNNLDVDPRGRISSNPDGNFGDLPDLHTVIPLLPPAGSRVGDRWSEKYVLPNPSAGDKRAYALNGQYLRDEGTGLSRLVVIQVHMLANVDDTYDYESAFGPLPAGSPAQVTVHDTGTEIVDVTYWYDPVHQALSKSTAKHDLNQRREFSDTSTGKSIGSTPLVGTEAVSFTRS